MSDKPEDFEDVPAYEDIPGTWVFDAQRARKGYHLNEFLYSLMKAENREEFLADERKYLQKFPMTDEQREAVMKRAWNKLLELGGVSYATRQARVHRRQVLPVHGIANGRHDGEGIRADDAGWRALAGRLAIQVRRGKRLMAKIIAGIGTSHTPAIGAAVDNGRTAEPYWVPVFKGYEPAKKWMAESDARRRDHGLQRSRQRIRLQNHPDVRARLRG